MKKQVFAFLILFLLFSCATSYQKANFSGGYSDTRLQENMFSVNFDGNGYTSRQRASDFALLRCAELTIENGFKYFAILGANASNTTMYYNTAQSYNTFGHMNTYGKTTYGQFNTYGSGGTSIPIVKPSSSYNIVTFKEKPDKNIMVLDAEFLMQSIAEKYGFKVIEGKIIDYRQGTSGRPKASINSTQPSNAADR